MLEDIRPCGLDFTVVMTGKSSRRVNGLYKPATREILLHNKNFKTDGELVYTAVHEYAHHLINEEDLRAAGGQSAPKGAKAHTSRFWVLFHDLLDCAERKGYYSLDLSASPELKALTDEIRTRYIEPNARLMQELGKALGRAYALCEESHIRYEDYVDRVLQITRGTERTARKVGMLPEGAASFGLDGMKILSSIRRDDIRVSAESALRSGKSPDTVSAIAHPRAPERDPREALEQERDRLRKTIETLSRRLEAVEEQLEAL